MFSIKRGDLLPVLTFVLEDANGPVDLTNCVVTFIFRMQNDLAIAQRRTAGINITNALGGAGRYSWAPGDTDQVGQYSAEFEVKFPDNRVETFPNDSDLEFTIRADVG